MPLPAERFPAIVSRASREPLGCGMWPFAPIPASCARPLSRLPCPPPLVLPSVCSTLASSRLGPTVPSLSGTVPSTPTSLASTRPSTMSKTDAATLALAAKLQAEADAELAQRLEDERLAMAHDVSRHRQTRERESRLGWRTHASELPRGARRMWVRTCAHTQPRVSVAVSVLPGPLPPPRGRCSLLAPCSLGNKPSKRFVVMTQGRRRARETENDR